MIYIIDCGLGNIHAFINMFARMGLNAKRAKTAKDLSDANSFIAVPEGETSLTAGADVTVVVLERRYL